MTSPIKAVGLSLKNYAKFSGRAGRSEFWWFQLFYVLCFYGSHLLGNTLHSYIPSMNGNVLGAIVNLLLIVPMLSIQVRRLHDIGWSGWCVPIMYVTGITLSMIDVSNFGLPLLVLSAVYGVVVLLFALTIIAQYFRASNKKGDKYGFSQQDESDCAAALPQRFVPQEYIPTH